MLDGGIIRSQDLNEVLNLWQLIRQVDQGDSKICVASLFYNLVPFIFERTQTNSQPPVCLNIHHQIASYQ